MSKKPKIFIDAGHGGHDPGATGNGLREKDLTLKIAKKIESKLKGIATIKMSRTTDKYLSLTQRTNMANAWKADYFLSIHINAGGGTGYEDFVFNGRTSTATHMFRNIMHNEIIKLIPRVTNRGKKQANFAVLRQSRMPAMLSESLFIDRKADADLLKQDSFIDAIAQGHANGLIEIFNLDQNKGTKPVPKPKDNFVGKRVESKINNLRFYNKASWSDKDVVGRVNKGIGFPTIVRKVKVGKGYQYEVKNSKGATFYITASDKYVNVVGQASQSTPKPAATVDPPSGSFGRGARGNRVRQLQRALNAANYRVGKVDGIYGAKTQDAVRRIQSMYETNARFVDGIYGPRTRGYILRAQK